MRKSEKIFRGEPSDYDSVRSLLREPLDERRVKVLTRFALCDERVGRQERKEMEE